MLIIRQVCVNASLFNGERESFVETRPFGPDFLVYNEALLDFPTKEARSKSEIVCQGSIFD